ncbi:hypothetical protein DV733_09195 [Halapricum salinum]|uniref:Uncharacterized protein n=2 Tax=Halapricum salinum TaxID=1457250 RepID=A0A4D6HCT9_9EURY|nr:hypothetical protein DV733_09195 [Halapricum salinum]
MTESENATAYPTSEQYQRWCEEAANRDMSVSEFIQAMVETGLKAVSIEVTPDESRRELRHQRNDLKKELDRARDRIEELEDQLHDHESRAIEQYVASNPGASFEEILQFVVDSAPRRVNTHLHTMEGDTVRIADGQYYPVEQADEAKGAG